MHPLTIRSAAAVFCVLLASFAVQADEEESYLCGVSVGLCPGGCWNSNGIVESDGKRLCEPVTAGYYSPFLDDDRYLCDSGTYSDFETAYFCTQCFPGSHATEEGSIFLY